MAKKTFRLGVCTGGGDCPGLNAAIRAITRHAIMTHGYEVLGVPNGLTGLVEDENHVLPLTLARVNDIIEHGGTILGTTNQGNPFRDKTRGPRIKQAMIRAFKRHRFDALIVIGGDGTQFMTRELVLEGLPIVGIPKTIDNDLCGTDLTIGFATAVEIAAQAAMRLRTCADAHNRAMLLEVMGRDAGHIALHSALAAGADYALIPEIAFDLNAMTQRLKARRKSGHAASLIIVAEGTAPRGGYQVFQTTGNGTKVLGGIGSRLAHQIQERAGIDARATVLGHLQRGGPPNAADRILASRFGVHAVNMVAVGDFGKIVCSIQGQLGSIPYQLVEHRRRTVDLSSDTVLAAEATGLWLGRGVADHAKLRKRKR